MRARRIGAALRRIGPRPLLLLRYVWHKARTAIGLQRLRRGYGRIVASPPAGAVLEPLGAELPPVGSLPQPLREAAGALRDEAETVMAGEVPILGVVTAELGSPIEWNMDFASGHRWPPAFYQDVEVTRLDDRSDAKVPWELSRGHQLLTLVRAAALFGDSRYTAEVERQLAEWLEANPPGRGINWANPMEVAIRAVNWVWAVGTLERAGMSLDPDQRAAVTRSLQAHGRHLAANLEGTPYLRGNHYLADILGLLVLGTCLRDDPAAPSWSAFARRSFEREIRAQILPDGVSFEASLHYHGLVLEMLLLARHVAAASGSPLSPRFDRRLALMLDVSRAVRHADGRMPQLGDCDSGRILPGSSRRPPTHDPLLWIGSAELRLPRPLPGPPDPEVAWTLGASAWEVADAAGPQEADPPTAFERGGIFILAGGGTRVVARCGDVGQNGNGGHAHNDLLSFELHREGRPLVVDPGTYTYTADPAARNAFRATAAHNTIEIDGHEINPIDPGELFRLRQVARPTVHRFEDGARLVASHDGYRRLPCRATHRREFNLDGATGNLTVVDAVEGRGECECAIYLHLAPGVALSRSAEDRVRVKGDGADFTVRFEGLTDLRVRDGWVSEAYGQRERAPVLSGLRVGGLPAAIRCCFEFGT